MEFFTKKKLWFLFILLIFTAGHVISITKYPESGRSSVRNKEFSIENRIYKVETSDTWFFNGTGIYIDDNNPNYNWSKTAADNDWCSGLGTNNNPYVIENVTIDANNSGSAIQIRFSSKYFIIRNSILYNSGIGSIDAGISLYRTDNGIITNNSIKFNNNGIYFDLSDNNSIFKNNISLNAKNGIYFFASTENTMYNNTLNSNSNNGLYLHRYCDRNNSTRNIIKYNNHNGILINRDGGGSVYWNLILENNISFNKRKGINCISYWEMKYNNISNNIISNNLEEGIYMTDNADQNYVTGNIINNNVGHGIHIDYIHYSSDNNLIMGNIINNNDYGIKLYYSPNNLVLNNSINNNDYGMHISRSDSNLIANNTLSNNIIAFYTIRNYWNNYTGNKMFNCGFVFIPYYDYIITAKIDSSNLVNGKPLYYYFNESNLQSTNFSNAGQIILINTDNSVIENLNLTHGTVGIQLVRCNNITISENNFTGNTIWGLYISESTEIKIVRNIITNIDGDAPTLVQEGGIFLYGNSDSNFISENLIYNNSNYGLYVSSSCDNNLISLNNFTENLINAINFAGANQWDNGSIGNYWDDYLGIDADDDGIGDIPYSIGGSGGSTDNFPIWDDGDDISPVIIINSPNQNNLFEHNAPEYNISVFERYTLNTTWYTLNGGTKKYIISNLTGYINQIAWAQILNGTVAITFYANDSIGLIGFSEVTVYKDIKGPEISIHSPSYHSYYGIQAPSFDISVVEGNLDTIWYILYDDQGFVIYSTLLTEFTGSINQSEWDLILNGTSMITFIANDTFGHLGNTSVYIFKDTIAPMTTIFYVPHEAPSIVTEMTIFTLSSTDPTGSGGSLIRYKINNSGWIDYTSPFDLIGFQPGNYSISYYAVDAVNNVEVTHIITVNLVAPPSKTITIPGYHIILFIVIFGITYVFFWKGFYKKFKHL